MREVSLTRSGRYNAVVKVWAKTTDDITEALKKSLKADNPIKMMADSGARGNDKQIKQLAGMRGNMAIHPVIPSRSRSSPTSVKV